MFKCTSDLEECECSCHFQDGVYHLMACCDTCPACQKRIKFRYNEHVTACKEEYIKYLEKVLVRELTEEEKKSLF